MIVVLAQPINFASEQLALSTVPVSLAPGQLTYSSVQLPLASAQYLPEPILELLTPVLIAILAATLSYIGWVQVSRELDVKRFFTRRASNLSNSSNASLTPLDFDKHCVLPPREAKSSLKQVMQMLLACGASFAISILLTTSLEISFALALLVTAIPFFIAKRSAEKKLKAQELAWPLAIDALISSLQAGQSITEAVQALATYGPDELIPAFTRVKTTLEAGETIELALLNEMHALDSSATDQTLTTLLIAKEFGGRDVTATLRLLSSFLRDDFEAQEEIKTKFGWVKNSALLGASAPWLILLLLSAQKDTVAAYQTPAGKTVLSIGVIATAVAFLWMERVARLPEPARPLKI